MQAIQFPSLADLAKLPAQGAGRDRQLRRIVDLYAENEAAASLQAALARSAGGNDLLVAADAILAGRDGARPRLLSAVLAPQFPALLGAWVRELRATASARPDTGACTVASALELWTWTFDWFVRGEGARTGLAEIAVEELADLLCPLAAARCLAVEPSVASDVELRRDLSQVEASRVAAQTGAVCAELVFGYRSHKVWDAAGCASCYDAAELDDLEALVPGAACGARMASDVLETNGSHPAKQGPCASFEGLDDFMRLRHRLDGCLTGARIARDRAAAAIGRSLSNLEGKA
jgi:hypothetical protein